MVETKRLVFKPMQSFENFIKVYTDPVLVGIWPEDEITEDKLKEKFEHKTRHWQENGFGVFEIYLKSGEFIGLAGVEKENDYVKISGMGLSEYHGKFGIALEAMYGLLKYAFENNIAEELITYTYETNIIPQKMMKFFGGHMYYKTVYKGDNSVYYKITKGDFGKLKKARFD